MNPFVEEKHVHERVWWRQRRGEDRVIVTAAPRILTAIPRSYGTLIDGFIGLCKLGRTSKVQNLLADMHYSGHIPNSITYNALLDSLCKAQYLTRQLHYFKNLWTKDQSRSVYVQYYSKGFVQMQKTKDCKRIFSTSCDQQL
ncbi:hypothetical protein HN51_048053 [Arachis hypogaea]